MQFKRVRTAELFVSHCFTESDHSPTQVIMALRRPPTRIELKTEDMAEYDEVRACIDPFGSWVLLLEYGVLREYCTDPLSVISQK